MAKILFKKKIYGFEWDCEDEFGNITGISESIYAFPSMELVGQ